MSAKVTPYTFEAISRAGYFGSCDHCGKEIEGKPVTYWRMNLRNNSNRYYCSREHLSHDPRFAEAIDIDDVHYEGNDDE